MKVCINGGINLSILDGWWCEGYTGDNGWAIGAGEEYTDLTYQDDIESRAIYDLLEQEIVPLFYNRGTDGLPRGWLKVMKRAMTTVCPMFNTSRMVQEYMEKCYAPSADRFGRLTREQLKQAANLAQFAAAWPVAGPRSRSNRSRPTAPTRCTSAASWKSMPASTSAACRRTTWKCSSSTASSTTSAKSRIRPRRCMSHNGPMEGQVWVFKGTIPCRSSGQHGYAVRVLPKNADLANPFEPGLVCWG